MICVCVRGGSGEVSLPVETKLLAGLFNFEDL